MCKAIEYSNKILKVYDEISKDFSILCDEQSKTDLMIQDILHTIENTNFNASEGYKYAKQLKDIRNGRRDIKEVSDLLDLGNTGEKFIYWMPTPKEPVIKVT